MNKKHEKCSFPECTAPHRRNGYCANHSQKFKRGTLFLEKTEKLCLEEGCGRKHYSKGFCLRHYRKEERKKISNRASEFRSNYESGNINFTYKEHSTWARSVKRYFGNECMICGWNKASCDAHHIIEKSKGGLNTLQNALVLCPNHHAEVHANLFTIEQLQKTNTTAIELKTEEI